MYQFQLGFDKFPTIIDFDNWFVHKFHTGEVNIQVSEDVQIKLVADLLVWSFY